MAWLFTIKRAPANDMWYADGEVYNGQFICYTDGTKHGQFKDKYTVSSSPNTVYNGTVWMEEYCPEKAARLFYAEALYKRDELKHKYMTYVERCRFLSFVANYNNDTQDILGYLNDVCTAFKKEVLKNIE